MSSTRGSKTLSEIAKDLCRTCRKTPRWYFNMTGHMPGLNSYLGYSEMPELIPEALVVETAARGHLKCLGAALSASPGQYECIDGFQQLQPGSQPLLQFDTGLLYGPSALMVAAWNGHPKCVDLLIKEKFLICTDDSEVCTIPICLAADKGNKECFDLLFTAHIEQNSIPEAFENAIETGSEECVRMLIAAGADVNQVDKYGRTLLIIRNPSDNAVITKALIDAGVDPNIESDEDGTALITHIREGSFKSMCILLDAGADVNTADDEGTPLMHVVDGYMKHKWSFVVALLLKGAKINISGNSGVNPLTHSLLQRGLTVDHKLQSILFAAGEKINRQIVESKGKKVPKHLQPQFNLKDICRRKIREHLLHLDPHTHLFSRVPKLEIPDTLRGYLLYEQKLDDTKYMKILSRMDEDDDFDDDDDFEEEDDDDDDDDDDLIGSDADNYSSNDEDVGSYEDIDADDCDDIDDYNDVDSNDEEN